VTHRVLASTTSHKREPLLETLEVFSRLDLLDLDLNLHHFIEGGISPDDAASAVAAHGQIVWVTSGGWCDFFHDAAEVDETLASVRRQVEIADRLGARVLRLFFGRLPRTAYGKTKEDAIVGNLLRLSDCHAAMTFIFENHDGASLVPEICRDVLARVDRPNIRMNFDPINFARAGVDPAAALAIVEPLVSHVHLKGLDHGEFCEFGTGDTVRLFRSVERARAVTASLH
jgi:sugar phosphate isomerase/epimerase